MRKYKHTNYNTNNKVQLFAPTHTPTLPPVGITLERYRVEHSRYQIQMMDLDVADTSYAIKTQLKAPTAPPPNSSLASILRFHQSQHSISRDLDQ